MSTFGYNLYEQHKIYAEQHNSVDEYGEITSNIVGLIRTQDVASIDLALNMFIHLPIECKRYIVMGYVYELQFYDYDKRLRDDHLNFIFAVLIVWYIGNNTNVVYRDTVQESFVTYKECNPEVYAAFAIKVYESHLMDYEHYLILLDNYNVLYNKDEWRDDICRHLGLRMAYYIASIKYKGYEDIPTIDYTILLKLSEYGYNTVIDHKVITYELLNRVMNDNNACSIIYHHSFTSILPTQTVYYLKHFVDFNKESHRLRMLYLFRDYTRDNLLTIFEYCKGWRVFFREFDTRYVNDKDMREKVESLYWEYHRFHKCKRHSLHVKFVVYTNVYPYTDGYKR